MKKSKEKDNKSFEVGMSEKSQQGSDFKKSSSKVKKGISKADRSSEDKYSKKKTNIKGKDDESTDDEKTSESKKPGRRRSLTK